MTQLISEHNEPPLFAVGALCRTLEEVAEHGPEGSWLLVFFDLLDKARASEPSQELNFLVQAAVASAPTPQLRDAARLQSNRFERDLRRQLREGTALDRRRDAVEVLIVVPKRVERLAVDAAFGLSDEIHAQAFDSGIRYRRFRIINSKGTKITCAIACLQEAGNLLASNVVRDAVSAFGRPALAILCGMAMSTRPDELGLGDVVVAQAVHDYAPRRVTDTGVMSRFREPQVDRSLLYDLRHHADASRSLIDEQFRKTCALGTESPDADVIVLQRPSPPKVKIGVVLSGEELVEDGSGPDRSLVHDRIYALEMEGAGFADACEHVGIPWTVVRGLADIGARDRSKEWQWTATAAAASFLQTFLVSSWVKR